MVLRMCSGFIGVLMLFGMIASLFSDGSFIHGKHALAMLLMPFAFLLYAFGGQKLIRQFVPMFAESAEQETKVKVQPTNGQDK